MNPRHGSEQLHSSDFDLDDSTVEFVQAYPNLYLVEEEAGHTERAVQPQERWRKTETATLITGAREQKRPLTAQEASTVRDSFSSTLVWNLFEKNLVEQGLLLPNDDAQ